MSSLSHKIDFAVILHVRHANPNGDPLNGNRPRTDYNGLGEITDVCLKRKMRDRLMDAGELIFVQSDDRKKDDATSLSDRAAKALKGDFGGAQMAKKACETWFDVRAFGRTTSPETSMSKPKFFWTRLPSHPFAPRSLPEFSGLIASSSRSSSIEPPNAAT